MTLPNWLPLVHSALPASLYTPRLREALETLVVYWMAFSGLWALWQVVYLRSLNRAFIEPSSSLHRALILKALIEP